MAGVATGSHTPKPRGVSMCIVCLEIATGRMKSYEARLARVELQHMIPEEHDEDLEVAIQIAERRENRNNTVEDKSNDKA